MYRIIRKILSKSVLIVVLFHALIHHSQADQMSVDGHIDIHQNSSSLFGIIKIVFHESKHDNLDNIVSRNINKAVSSYNYFLPILLAVKWIDIVPVNSAEEKLSVNNEINYSKVFYVNSNRLRGPPECI